MCKRHKEYWVEKSLQSNKVNASEEPAKGIKKIDILTVDKIQWTSLLFTKIIFDENLARRCSNFSNQNVFKKIQKNTLTFRLHHREIEM